MIWRTTRTDKEIHIETADISSQKERPCQLCDRLPTHYWRYVDDVWGLWEHGLEKLQEFQKLANSLHPRIKTELRFSSQQIEFLDVNIKIKDGFIQTDLFSKDTDKHMYLHITSSHPNSVKTAITYGLRIRAKLICSEDEDYSVRQI